MGLLIHVAIPEFCIQVPPLTISTFLQESRMSVSYSAVCFKPDILHLHIQMETLYDKKEKFTIMDEPAF